MKTWLLSFSLFLAPSLVFCQNVGIATNNPQTTLDVKGNLRIGGANKYMSYDSITGKIIWNNSVLFVPVSQYLIQHSASAEGLYYGNAQMEYRDASGVPVFSTNWNTGDGHISGKLGIGTISPGAKLHVSSAGDEIIRMDANQPFLSLYSGGVYKGYLWKSPNSIEVGSASGSNLPITLAPNGVQTMLIHPNGNVGINVANPSRRLEIAGPDTARMLIGSTSGFGPAGLELLSDYGTASTWRPGFFLTGDNGNFTGRLDFYNNGTGSNNKFGMVHAMSLVDGKVGIGTTTPAVRLHVSGSNEALRLEANNPFLSLYSAGIYKGYFWYQPNGIELGSAAGSGLPVILAPDGNPQVYATANGNLGIGISTPNAPLGFAALFGKKITLFPGSTGDAGFGISGNRLSIYADNPNADVAIGYDAAGTFNERFAVKGNGSIAYNGNPGMPGQVLQSNGPSSAPTWITPSSLLNTDYMVQGTASMAMAGGAVVDLPGLITTINTGASPVTTIISFSVPMYTAFCPGCSPSDGAIEVLVNSVLYKSFGFTAVNTVRPTTCSGSVTVNLQSNSSVVIKLRGVHYLPSQPFTFSVNTSGNAQASNMVIQTIVQ